MEVNDIIEIAEKNNFAMRPYTEGGELCGYELETWTEGGVNMIHFIDCRRSNYSDGVTAENVLEELKEISAYFDVDEEIDVHREGDSYRKAFTIRQSVEDFDEYEKRLTEFVREVQEKFDACNPSTKRV